MSDLFSPSSLQKAVHDSFEQAQAAIPEGHNKALLLHGTYSSTSGPAVQAIYVQRAGKGWNVLFEGAYHGTDGPSAGVEVAWSGK